MKSQAVIGLGFGDEGKGKVVSALAALSDNPLIIRYCGGQQAGHHVVLRNGLDHVSSNFGSGTLQGFDTYWSQYCTVDPVAVLNELDVLKGKGISPFLYIDERCPITTPYDKKYNKETEGINQHGSCGVGVGQTIQREENHYSLRISDLRHPSVFKMKLELLTKSYYHYQGLEIGRFIETCEELFECPNVLFVNGIPKAKPYDNYIFEGSQGLLLDQEIGFFPHVTRANTGTKNIVEMIGFTPTEPEIFLVTRAYQTRHGNGPMTQEFLPHNIKENPYELNKDDCVQGNFRKSILDLDLLRYAISRDPYLCDNKNLSLVITCLDLIGGYPEAYAYDRLQIFNGEDDFAQSIKYELHMKNVYLSKNPFPEFELYQQKGKEEI